MTRWVLDQTLAVCQGVSQTLLQQALQSIPLKKPEGHQGDELTDMFVLSLSTDEVVQILHWVGIAIEQNKQTTGPFTRDYQGIQRTWLEYQSWIKKRFDS